MISVKALVIGLILGTVALQLAAPAEAKVRSRGQLVGDDAVQSSYSVNPQPMYMAQAPPAPSRNRNRNRMMDYDKLEQLVQELDQAQSPLESAINSQMLNRDKKSKSESADESAPIESHRRKNYFVKETSGDAAKTCASQMSTQALTIVDSKTSLANGASFIRIEYIETMAAKKGLNYPQEECKRLCCEDAKCDTSLLNMKPNEDKKYRCYLYQCQDLCTMVQHKDFYVFMSRDVEQSQALAPEKPQKPPTQSSSDITTGHDHGACHKTYEFKCVSSGACIPLYDVCNSFDDCEDKSDEANCPADSAGGGSGSGSGGGKAKSPKDYVESRPVLVDDTESDDDVISRISPTEDDYETYKKLKQQADIEENLAQLEREFGRSGSKGSGKVVHKTQQDFLDALMKEAPSSGRARPESAQATSSTKSTTTTRAKNYFHDAHNFDMSVDTFQNSPASKSPPASVSAVEAGLRLSDEDRAYFFDKALASKTSIAMAVLILVLGIGLVIAFFVYLFVNTKFVARRIKWLAKKQGKNLDVEADYLINGMYL